ncbi:hypothetical protein CH367_20570 [Leptospira barantonii]|uniref:Uncharacterized protein n=1 Tax=Leptospira barantonii TaxID=2023184 RepID=A0ABX4NF01_9LEPT|nr:hypothetical protein CH367_20570 [Leptospira barantonii]
MYFNAMSETPRTASGVVVSFLYASFFGLKSRQSGKEVPGQAPQSRKFVASGFRNRGRRL